MSGRISIRSGHHEVMKPGDKGANLINLPWRNDSGLTPLPARIVIGTTDTDATPAMWTLDTYADLSAVIEWQNDGAVARMEVDIGRGVVVTAGPCQSLAVSASYNNAPANWVNGPELRVSASAVYGLATQGLGPCTHYYGPIKANQFGEILRIPPFARNVQLLGDLAVGRSNLTLRLYGDNNPGSGFATKRAIAEFDMNQNDVARVQRGCQFYQILNRGGQPITVTALWDVYC